MRATVAHMSLSPVSDKDTADELNGQIYDFSQRKARSTDHADSINSSENSKRARKLLIKNSTDIIKANIMKAKYYKDQSQAKRKIVKIKI